MSKYQFTFTHVPPVCKRSHTVLVALFNQKNYLVLARKQAYPPGIYRLFGGGVDPAETPEQAIDRELMEETGLSTKTYHQQTFTFKLLESSTQYQYLYTIDLYYASLAKHTITVSDDVDDYKSFTPLETQQLLKLYHALSSTLVSPRPNQTFCWHDWGIVFSIPLKYVHTHWPATSSML